MSDETRETLTAFLQRTGLKFKATLISVHNPEWPEASHWRCVFMNPDNNKRFQVQYHQGSAHTQPPKAEDVLNCITLDVASLENNADFASWCGEFGYDTDSRKTEKMYKQIQRQQRSLRRLFSNDSRDYERLLWQTESL